MISIYKKEFPDAAFAKDHPHRIWLNKEMTLATNDENIGPELFLYYSVQQPNYYYMLEVTRSQVEEALEAHVCSQSACYKAGIDDDENS